MPLPALAPPLLNSANPRCSSKEDLALWNCQFVGAVTTRTFLLAGFPDDPSIHQHRFFNPAEHHDSPPGAKDGSIHRFYNASLNTYGYSPRPLSQYLTWIRETTNVPPSYWPSDDGSAKFKPFIISVTGTPSEILSSYTQISSSTIQSWTRLSISTRISPLLEICSAL